MRAHLYSTNICFFLILSLLSSLRCPLSILHVLYTRTLVYNSWNISLCLFSIEIRSEQWNMTTYLDPRVKYYKITGIYITKENHFQRLLKSLTSESRMASLSLRGWKSQYLPCISTLKFYISFVTHLQSHLLLEASQNWGSSSVFTEVWMKFFLSMHCQRWVCAFWPGPVQ